MDCLLHILNTDDRHNIEAVSAATVEATVAHSLLDIHSHRVHYCKFQLYYNLFRTFVEFQSFESAAAAADYILEL